MTWSDLTRFLGASLRPAADIAILAFVIYKTWQILVRTQAVQLVKGAILMALIYAAAYLLKLETLAWVLNFMAPGLVIALAIVFQPELRKIFVRLGQGSFFRTGKRPRSTQIEAVLNAAEALSTRRRGGLFVFTRSVGLKDIVDTGTALDALLSSSLLRSIFEHDGALHDGAVVIQGSRVAAAGCLLPLSARQDIARSFGTRHRAALGMSEQSDAVVLVVSEETGALSLAYDARLYYNLSPALVQRRLTERLELSGSEPALEEEALG